VNKTLANVDKSVEILVASMIGALLVLIFGDFVVDMAFEEGSTGAQIVNYAPIILVALGLYGAYREYTSE